MYVRMYVINEQLFFFITQDTRPRDILCWKTNNQGGKLFNVSYLPHFVFPLLEGYPAYYKTALFQGLLDISVWKKKNIDVMNLISFFFLKINSIPKWRKIILKVLMGFVAKLYNRIKNVSYIK